MILAAPIDKIDNILNMFNSYHNKLQFIIKHETNHNLSFLDLSLIRTDDKLVINCYQKSTFSGRYLSYYSCHSFCHKIGSVYGLVEQSEQSYSSIQNFARKILNLSLIYY